MLGTCHDAFPDWYPLLLTALRPGMRLGELLSLGWDDIDFPVKRIQVRRGYRSNLVANATIRFTNPGASSLVFRG